MPPTTAMLDPPAEAALLARVRGGANRDREAAFEELFREFRGPVLGLCLHLCGRGADAEDAVQETFLAVHEGLPGFRGESRLSTWIYRIAIRSALRVRARRPRRMEPLVEQPCAGPADPVVEREEAARLSAALDELPAESRVVLSLFAQDELSHAEIAAVLGIAEGTVWSRLHVARKRLASLLEPKTAPGMKQR